MSKRRVGVGDSGASLMLVLIFVLVVGTALAALLPYTEEGIDEAATARQVRTLQNAVDGAMQGAIDQARLNTDACVGSDRPTYTAPSYPDPVQPTNPAAATNVTVTCAPAGSSTTNSNVPPYAILTTNGPLTVTGNHVLSVVGGVYASGPITTASGAGNQLLVDVVGPVYTTKASGGGAGYSCDAGLVYSSAFAPSGTPHCPVQSGDPSFPDTTSASYPSSLGTSVPTPTDPLGECTGNGVVTFVPGYYSEIPQVDQGNGPNSCGSKPPSTWWLSPGAGPGPGTYYFDFPDGSYANYSNGQAMWNLQNTATNLIGGTLNSAGTGCDPTGTGVQVVLGGATQLATGNNSSIQLCASPTAPGSTAAGSQQQIALYGIPSDYTSAISGPRTTTAATTTQATTASASGDVPFSPAGGAKKAGDLSTASAVFTNNSKTTTAVVALSNYSTPSNGSLVTLARLEVTHSESSNKMQPSVTVSMPWNGTTYTATCQVSQSTLPTTTEVDLMGSGCNWSPNSFSFATAPLRYKLMQNMTVTYTVSDPKNTTGAATVDGVELKTQTVAPAIEAERPEQGEAAANFCAFTNAASPSSTDCSTATTANSDTFFVGTVYTPQAADYAVVHNTALTIFRRGVIAQSLTVDANSSSKQTDSPFQLPSSFTSRDVLFTATVGGKVELRAKVHFIDFSDTGPPNCANYQNPSGAATYFPGRGVCVLEWTDLDQ